MSNKISDEFWTYVQAVSGSYYVHGPDMNEVCKTYSEADAKLICDEHNALLVQVRRGWQAEKCTGSERWHNPMLANQVLSRPGLPSGEEVQACYGPTPVELMLNGNRWVEEREGEVKP